MSDNRVVFPPKEAKGKKHHRVIYLATERLARSSGGCARPIPDGPMLRNSAGKPWTKDSINCAFCRLKKKLGTKFHMGAFRKGFATEALEQRRGHGDAGPPAAGTATRR